MGLFAQNTAPRDLEEGERRDWELWSIALILLTAFAGGVILFTYSGGLLQRVASPAVGHFQELLVFSLVGFVLLVDIYLIDKRRSLSRKGSCADIKEFEKRDWELWAIALVLLTVFAGGAIASVYSDHLVQSILSPEIGRSLGLLLFGLIGLVFLINVYLIDKRRSLHEFRHEFQH